MHTYVYIICRYVPDLRTLDWNRVGSLRRYLHHFKHASSRVLQLCRCFPRRPSASPKLCGHCSGEHAEGRDDLVLRDECWNNTKSCKTADPSDAENFQIGFLQASEAWFELSLSQCGTGSQVVRMSIGARAHEESLSKQCPICSCFASQPRNRNHTHSHTDLVKGIYIYIHMKDRLDWIGLD